MAASTGYVRRVSATYTFPHVAVDLLDAHKPVAHVIQENGINAEHIIGAEMRSAGSLQSSWRYVGSAGPKDTPCDALSYLPAQIPWGTAIAGRGEASGIACRFTPDYFHTITGIGNDWSERHLRACQDLSSSVIRDMVRKIYHEIRTPGFASDIVISSLSHVILVELARYFQAIASPDEERRTGTLSKRDLDRIRGIVENALNERLSIRQLANALGYSEGYFYGLFKQSTGITPHKYIETLRIEKAMELLAGDGHSIKQIAYAVGFSNPSSFSAAFRRVTGSSPSQAMGQRPSRLSKLEWA
ncbi:helix-turn-helix domain-containing protein [Sphingomonas sp. KC8]|uniref:helix-turn-helix domain-containing protein n=1 Tax=Sphingomonas sp. KC8 TaxID=1030157 RepID=UPI0002488A5F|nr:AraC family transcriptional regulator [Sphingomonas sp. KC8]ARS25824.1 hypothetical protein KC8_00750 [Sphingomonas sp. KC8]